MRWARTAAPSRSRSSRSTMAWPYRAASVAALVVDAQPEQRVALRGDRTVEVGGGGAEDLLLRGDLGLDGRDDVARLGQVGPALGDLLLERAVAVGLREQGGLRGQRHLGDVDRAAGAIGVVGAGEGQDGRGRQEERAHRDHAEAGRPARTGAVLGRGPLLAARRGTPDGGSRGASRRDGGPRGAGALGSGGGHETGGLLGREVGTGREQSLEERLGLAGAHSRVARWCEVQAQRGPPAFRRGLLHRGVRWSLRTTYRRDRGVSGGRLTRVSPLGGRVILGCRSTGGGGDVRAPTRRRGGARGGCAARCRPRWRRRPRPW